MEIIKTPIYVKLTETERKTLRDAYDILNELYNIIADNDCEYVSDTCGMAMTDQTWHLRLMCFRCLPLLKK